MVSSINNVNIYESKLVCKEIYKAFLFFEGLTNLLSSTIYDHAEFSHVFLPLNSRV